MSRKAPSMVGDLSDEQVDRWREGDQTVWNEDSKGRALSQRAIERRDAAERREAGEREWEAGS